MADASSIRHRVLEDFAKSFLLVKIDSVRDYQDGKLIQTLVENLSGKKISPRKSMLKRNPIEAFLKSNGVPISNIKGFTYPLTVGEVYAFLEVVCLHYKVTIPCRQALSNFVSDDPRECLLNWLRTNMPPGARKIQGFHDQEWRTGEYFAALINAKSDGEKYDDWRFKYSANVTLEMIFRDAAHCLLGVNSLLTEEDFASGKAPDTAMMLYLSQFVNAQYGSLKTRSDGLYADNRFGIPVYVEHPNFSVYEQVQQFPPYENVGNSLHKSDSDPGGQDEPHYSLPDTYVMREVHPDKSEGFNISELNGSRDMEAAWSHLKEQQKEEITSFFRAKKCLSRSSIIGQGVSGYVYKGRFMDDRVHQMVAAKCISIPEKEDACVVQKKWGDAFTEICNMARLRHENVIELIAVVIFDKLPHLIMPLLEQDLLNYVSSNKLNIPKLELNAKVLDVATALEYLSELEYIHRDVAARNCMIDRRGRVKLGDLGLMRDSLIYTHIGQSTLAYRWAAPEVLNMEPSSSMSDVWSFGVLYWEVLSWGEEPYKYIRMPEELIKALESRDRLPKPESASDQEYELMTDCWEHEPEDRPDFPMIVQQLGMILSSAKTEDSTDRQDCDMSQVNPQMMHDKVEQTPKKKPPPVKPKPQPRPRLPRVPVPVHSQPMDPTVQTDQEHTDSPVEVTTSTSWNAQENSPASDMPPPLPPRNSNVRISCQRERSGDESD